MHYLSFYQLMERSASVAMGFFQYTCICVFLTAMCNVTAGKSFFNPFFVDENVAPCVEVLVLVYTSYKG